MVKNDHTNLSEILNVYSDLRLNRSKLLELLTDPNHSRETVDKASTDYLSLLIGLCIPMDQNEPENKLRKLIKFKWTNSLLGNVPRYVVNVHLYAHSFPLPEEMKSS